MTVSFGKSGIIAVAMAVLALALAPPGDAAAQRCGRFAAAPGTLTDHQLRTSVLCLVNLARERNGIAPLRYSAALRRSATAHSKNMVRMSSLSHYGPGGSTPTTRIARSGYLASFETYRLAENIGAGQGPGYGSPLAITRGWLRSAGHRRNILDRGLHDFGVGIARGNPFGADGNAATYTLDLGARHR